MSGADESRPEALAGERVRACPACAEVVRFGERTCPVCGHLDPLRRAGSDELDVPCPHCGEAMVATRLYCSQCGRERGLPPPPPPGEPLEWDRADGLDRLALAVAFIGPLVLLAAVLAVFV